MSADYCLEEEGPSAPANQGILDDPDDDTLRVMVSTDNHLGYEENDSVRGNDSFAAFEEVLYLAKRFRCDMVLLAGDLFHENRPSRRTLYKTMNIIRRYSMGPNPVRIQITSDPAQNFRTLTGKLNYQDENFAVDLPIFSIHGNHDDPTRDGGDLLAALDLLAISNMVNYFGCQEEVDDVRLYPAMLQKGSTQIALYGLGSMRDERLNRMWRSGKVKFFRYQNNNEQQDDDEEEEDGGDDIFNMFVLHQNRDLGRGAKNCVQETLIPDFCDLVVWGHEHECQIEFAESLVGTFRISQPGSSVATSLVAGEAVRKKVGVLDIKGKNFRLHPVPLTQVRSFITGEINLRENRANLDPDDSQIMKKVTKVLEEQVSAIIMDANDERKKIIDEARAAGSNAGDEDSPLVGRLLNPEKVLVRLRVEHSGFQTLNNQRFGAKFVDEIANSDNILLFHRKKQPKMVESKATRKVREALKKPMEPEELERTNVEDIVGQILKLPDSKLNFLSEKGLGEALEEYVDKNNLQSIPSFSEDQLKKKQKLLIKNKTMSGKAEDVNAAFEHDEADKAEDEDAMAAEEVKSTSTKSSGKKRNTTVADEKKEFSGDEEVQDLDADDDDDDAPPPKTLSRSSKANTTSKNPGGSATTGRRKQKLPEDDDDDDNDSVVVIDDDPAPKSKGRSSRRSTKKVNYSIDDGDEDEEESDAVVDMMDEDDDDMEAEETKPKGRKAAASRGTKSTTTKTKATPASRRKAATSARKTGRKKKFLADDSDDDDDGIGGSVRLDENWGSGFTK